MVGGGGHFFSPPQSRETETERDGGMLQSRKTKIEVNADGVFVYIYCKAEGGGEGFERAVEREAKQRSFLPPPIVQSCRSHRHTHVD